MSFEYLQWRLCHLTGQAVQCQCLLALGAQKHSLMLTGSLLCVSPLALVPSLGTAENSLALSVYLSFRYLHTLVRHHILPKLFSLGSATWHSHICSPSGKLNPYVFTGLWERGGLSIEFAMDGVVLTVIHDSWLVEKWVGLEKVLWKCSKMHISNLNNFCACKWGIIDCPGSSWIEDNNSVC